MGNQDVDWEIKLYDIMDQYDCDMDTAEFLLLDMEEEKETPEAATSRESKKQENIL